MTAAERLGGKDLLDAHPDGQRFLVRRNLTAGDRFVRPLIGISGWIGELRRKLAEAK